MSSKLTYTVGSPKLRHTLVKGIGIPHLFKISGLLVRVQSGVPVAEYSLRTIPPPACMMGIGIPMIFKISCFLVRVQV